LIRSAPGSTPRSALPPSRGSPTHYVSISPGPNNRRPSAMAPQSASPQTHSASSSTPSSTALQAQCPAGPAEFHQGQRRHLRGRRPAGQPELSYLPVALAAARRWMEEIGRRPAGLERFVVSSSELVTAISQRAPPAGPTRSRTRTRPSARSPSTRPRSTRPSPSCRAPSARQHDLPQPARRAGRHRPPGRHRQDRDPPPGAVPGAPAPGSEPLGAGLPQPGPLGRSSRQAERRPGHLQALAGDRVPGLVSFPHAVGRSRLPADARLRPPLHDRRPPVPRQARRRLGYYDANGPLLPGPRRPTQLTKWNSATHVLDPIPISQQFNQYGPPHVFVRCPGSAVQTAADASNPFVAPLWPDSGLTSANCNPSDLPQGMSDPSPHRRRRRDRRGLHRDWRRGGGGTPSGAGRLRHRRLRGQWRGRPRQWGHRRHRPVGHRGDAGELVRKRAATWHLPRARRSSSLRSTTRPSRTSRHASCQIRTQALIGEKFVDCRPTLPARPVLSRRRPCTRFPKVSPAPASTCFPCSRTAPASSPTWSTTSSAFPTRSASASSSTTSVPASPGRGEPAGDHSAAATRRCATPTRCWASWRAAPQLAQLTADSDQILRPLAAQASTSLASSPTPASPPRPLPSAAPSSRPTSSASRPSSPSSARRWRASRASPPAPSQ